MLEILIESFTDIRNETIEDSDYYDDDILRSKAKYTLLRLMLEDDE